MNTLRWILGIATVLLLGGGLFLFMVANGFRKSFGASENHPLLVILPVAAAGLLFAGLLLPANKPLLHGAAVVAVGLVGICIWSLIREAATVCWFAIFYLCAWLVYYGLAAWSRLPASDPMSAPPAAHSSEETPNRP